MHSCDGRSTSRSRGGAGAIGATEETFAALAERAGLRLARSVAVAWLTGRGHREPVLNGQVPADILIVLESIHSTLGGNRELLLTKRAVPIRLDFVDTDRKHVIEVDEIQHFTTDRLCGLELCTSALAAERYLELIKVWSQTADGYRAAKPASDFPFAGGRRAQRAYLDSVRDLLLPELGYRLTRVPAPECDGRLAFDRFIELDSAST